jgi:hypothetical protein
MGPVGVFTCEPAVRHTLSMIRVVGSGHFPFINPLSAAHWSASVATELPAATAQDVNALSIDNPATICGAPLMLHLLCQGNPVVKCELLVYLEPSRHAQSELSWIGTESLARPSRFPRHSTGSALTAAYRRR